MTVSARSRHLVRQALADRVAADELCDAVESGMGGGGSSLGDPVEVTHGGTGQVTAAAALTALLPNQGGQSGKFLSSDGTAASWAAGGGGGSLPPGFGPGAGANSIVSGDGTVALGADGLAEGLNTIAAGAQAIATGSNTIAAGRHSIAEGSNTIASCDACHSEGRNTIAGAAPIACTIAGATVTMAGDQTSWFGAGSPLALSRLVGGSGPAAMIDPTPSDPVFAGGVTTITLSTALTTHTAGGANLTDFVTGGHSEGADTIASGDASHSEGSRTIASGDSSHSEGRSSLASLPAQCARSDDGFGVVGDGQHSILQLALATADATPTRLLIGGGSGGSDLLLVRPNFTYGFTATLVARNVDGSASALFVRSGLVHNEAGTTALIGAVGTVGTDINAPGWAVDITANDTDDCLDITVTGAAATTIRWVCRVDLVEIGS